jgi:hypothetical protein
MLTPEEITKENNAVILANIVEIIPLVVRTIGEKNTDGAINASNLGQNTIKSLVTSRLTSYVNNQGAL